MKKIILFFSVVLILNSCQKEVHSSLSGYSTTNKGNVTIYSEVSNKTSTYEKILNEKIGTIFINASSNSMQDYLGKKGSLSISGAGEFNSDYSGFLPVSKFVCNGIEYNNNGTSVQNPIGEGAYDGSANFDKNYSLLGHENQISLFDEKGVKLYESSLYFPLPLIVSTVPSITKAYEPVVVSVNDEMKVNWNADPKNLDQTIYLILEDTEPNETSYPISIFILKDDGEFILSSEVLKKYLNTATEPSTSMRLSLYRANSITSTTNRNASHRVVGLSQSEVSFILK